MAPRPKGGVTLASRREIHEDIDALNEDELPLVVGAIDFLRAARNVRAGRQVRDDGSGLNAYPVRVTCPSCLGRRSAHAGPVCRDCFGSGTVSDILADLIERQGN